MSQINVDNIKNRLGSGAPSFPNGIDVSSGVTTFTNGLNVGTGASVFSPGTNVLALGTNSAERVRVDSTGNVGVGTDSVNIGNSDYRAIQIHAPGTNSYLVLTNNSSGADAANDGVSFILTGSNTNILNRESGDILLSTGGGERARVTSGGNVQIANGNLVLSTSGTGIDFSATGGPTNGTGSSELLDDYEEGTWDPSVGGTATYNSPRVGYYVKIGQLVSCYFYFQINTIGSGNNYQISGLPYTSQSTISTQGAIGYFSDLDTNVYWVGLTGGANDTVLYLRCQRALDASVDSSVSLLTSGSAIAGSITYRASS